MSERRISWAEVPSTTAEMPLANAPDSHIDPAGYTGLPGSLNESAAAEHPLSAGSDHLTTAKSAEAHVSESSDSETTDSSSSSAESESTQVIMEDIIPDDETPPRAAPDVPPAVVKRLLRFIPSKTRQSLRLTCKKWSRAIDTVMPLTPPAANIVPAEILFQIYAMLSPRDFDNARRTCSQWMRVSLDKDLLEGMLKRAGWWDAWQRDCQTNRPSDESLVWRLSRRFSTECLLSGRKINVERAGFLTTGVVDFSGLSRESLPKESPGYTKNALSGPYNAPRITAALRDPAFARSPKFSVSGCGHYLLVTTGCMIYVYHLRNRKSGDSRPSLKSNNRSEFTDDDLDIEPISSVGCPYEVLSATIDTSTPRFVIAALLRGRMGMICDIKGNHVHSPSDLSASSIPKSDASRRSDDVGESVSLRDAIASSATTSDKSPSPQRDGRSSPTKMTRLSRTPRRYYHDLCSEEDPPRSVSICPGRRCVAFGCGSGIELHWVDEKTKEDSRKLFPMSQPSEILHFLPNRSEVETPSNLRLISSLAGPGGSGCQCYNDSLHGEHRSTCRFHLLSGVHSFTHWTPRKNGSLSLVKATHCHHYRAIPINDGLHILFIEPHTGLLCIGSDAPIGGPTSLTRALICVPPFEKELSESGKEERIPTVFAAGSDLSWGLRIVAAYQDRIVLYSVPLDVFNVIRRERERQGDGVIGDSDLARDWFLDSERNRKRRGSLAQNQNGDWEFLLSVSYRPTAMMWPLKIYGKEIGRMDKVVEFAIQTSHGGVRVWAFGAAGEARIFDIDTCTSAGTSLLDVGVKSVSIGSDGSIASAKLMDRAESGLLSPLPTRATRKRKQLSQPAPFDRAFLTAQSQRNVSAVDDNNSSGGSAAKRRRPSFAACIIDLKIPELGAREGKWMETDNKRRKESDASEFHDIASYDPHDLRKALWSSTGVFPQAEKSAQRLLVNPVMYNEGYSAWNRY
ncbi:hypothetical protein VTN00DRAFT_3474 [Thermoascus crustaceus]|uniref:uncharacterized protein n=1 Tax=Thermoascus crustaceus TaxID=5088 RepID=UPI003744376D